MEPGVHFGRPTYNKTCVSVPRGSGRHNVSNKVLLVYSILLASLLMLASACSVTDEKPPTQVIPEGPIILENKGRVCFYPISENILRASISTGDSACLPSGCTEVLERRGDIGVDIAESIIQLHSRFVALDIARTPLPSGELQSCADNCGGAGRLDFETGELKVGTYTVRLGEEVMGNIDIPFRQGHVCFDNAERPIPFPTATHAGPTSTPWPSPLEPVSPLPTVESNP